MQNKTVGFNLNLLFVGYSLVVAVNVLHLEGQTGGLVGICALVGLVINVVALNNLKGCHPGYGKAFQYEIILIVFSVISVALIIVAAFYLPTLQMLVVPLVPIGSSVLNYFVVRHVSLSTADLVGDAGDLDTAALGALVNKIYLVCCAVSVVCTVLGLIPLLDSIFDLLGMLARLATIAGFGLLVCFLYPAKACLSSPKE